MAGYGAEGCGFGCKEDRSKRGKREGEVLGFIVDVNVNA